MLRSLSPLRLLPALLALIALGPLSRAASPDYPLRRIFISDTETKVMSMKGPVGHGRIILWDETLLASGDFDQAMSAYFGKPITPESVGQIVATLVGFVKSHGQQLVDVSVPTQNITRGDLRLIVILGHYDLKRLVLNDDPGTIAKLQVPMGSRSIVIQGLPLMESEDFARVCAPYFGKPLTEESISHLISGIDAYVKGRGQLLAHVLIPTQTISGGEFRMTLIIGQYPLKHVVIGSTAAETAAAQVGPNSGGVVTAEAPIFATKEFRRYIARFLDQPITVDATVKLRGAVMDYLKQHDFAVVNVPQPAVDPKSGVIRLTAEIGRYNQLVFRGNRWFSDRLLQRKLGIKPGDEVRLSMLQNALAWANQNPFRQVQVLVNTVNQPPGVADLDISVRERVPIRLAASYDQTGNDVIGNNHYTASVLFGNLWGRDHQFSYQFTTSRPGHLYRVHAFDYRAPLPWRNYLEMSAVYADVKPTVFNGIGHLSSKNVVADLKYIVPLTLGKWSLQSYLGFDYKQVQNNLVFRTIPIFLPAYTPYDVAQAMAGVTASRSDAHGQWTLGLTGDFAPGHFNSRDTDAVYHMLHPPDAPARYGYGTLQALRELDLPLDFQFFSRAEVQVSSANLVPSEQLSIGGSASVRGYNERILSGDQGFYLNEEFRGPLWRWHLPFTPKQWTPLMTRPLVFWDFGRVYYKHRSIYDPVPLGPIESAGVGVRSNIGSNFILAADYGWQILATPVYRQPNHSRGDVSITLAY